MRRLVVDARMINASGIGRYLRELLPFIVKKFETTIIGNRNDFKNFDWSKNIKVIHSDVPIYSIKEQIELFKKFPEADIFWSPHYNIPVFPIRAKKRVVTIHDVYHLAFYRDLTIAQKFYAKFMLNAAVSLSDVIITVSEFSKKEIQKYLRVKKEIKVIYNGVSQKYLNNYKEKKEGNYILFVGNVKPNKNLVRALKAFAKINVPDLKFKIVGERENFITKDTQVEKIARELGDRVEFTGYVFDNKLLEFYRNAQLLVFPSLYEGFGFPPLEAMASGTPVVVSKSASLPEICGDAAFYVDPYSIEDIKRGIETVLFDKSVREKLVRKGLDRVKNFTWERSALKHIKVFEEV